MGILPTEEFPSMTYVGSCVSRNTLIQEKKKKKKQSSNGKEEVLILT